MPEETRIVGRHYKPRMVKFDDGSSVAVPEGWALLPPGDAGLTRRVKAAGPTWTVKGKKGKRIVSFGIWAPETTIEAERARIEAERETPAYKKKLATARKRRDRQQAAYVEEFKASVLAFLEFDARHATLAAKLATAVTEHAVPVGSGTVARTKRIPVEQRAEAAVIAWMRHQTTAYDRMRIARVKGRRREVRAKLAAESRRLLAGYRRGEDVDTESCPLVRALT